MGEPPTTALRSSPRPRQAYEGRDGRAAASRRPPPPSSSRRTSWCGRSSSVFRQRISSAAARSAAPGAASPPPTTSSAPTIGASRRFPSSRSTVEPVPKVACHSWSVAAPSSVASCDGLLLLSLSDGRYSICNPATRQCAPLPRLTAAGRINVATLYLHGPSGEYRVLYWKGRHQDNHLKAACYILMVRRGRSPRRIGVPSDTPGIEELILSSDGITPTNYGPPVVFQNCLHWNRGFPSFSCKDARIVVFDTVVESFWVMRHPAGSTISCTLLCDMEGSIGFSCFDEGRTVAKIWLLEDYEREVWSFKYHVKFPVESLCNIEDTRHLVLSRKGDVLVYSRSQGYMFHCDSTGKLLKEFRCDRWSLSIIGHWFKESLVKQDISLRRGCGCVKQLRFFQRV